MNSLNTQLQTNRKIITQRLQKILADQIKQLPDSSWKQDVFRRLTNFAVNGKLIRGSLVLIAHDLLGANCPSQALTTACAIELIQSGILIHDDVIDEDELRRGKPTIHKQYETHAKIKTSSTAAKVGTSFAICVGDICFFLSQQLLGSLELPQTTKQHILTLTAQELQLVGLAEMHDVTISTLQKNATEAEIIKLYIHKTGRYSFGLPLGLGALLAQQDQLVNPLMELGELLGLLFQISDDALSLFGNSEKSGKSVGSDITRNNKTIHRLYLYNSVTTEEKKQLDQIFGHPLTDQKLHTVQDLLKKYAIQEKVARFIKQTSDKSYQLISHLPIEPEKQTMLREIVTLCINRSK